MSRGSLRPCEGAAIPDPRITEVVCAVVAAEENYSLRSNIIGHLRVGAARWNNPSTYFAPDPPIEHPGVIKVMCAVVTAEEQDALASSIVGHRHI